MTDETREQIKRDADSATLNPETKKGVTPAQGYYRGFQAGAIHVYDEAFSAGVQACLDKFNEVVKGSGSTMHADSAIVMIYKELEKLKV